MHKVDGVNKRFVDYNGTLWGCDELMELKVLHGTMDANKPLLLIWVSSRITNTAQAVQFTKPQNKIQPL